MAILTLSTGEKITAPDGLSNSQYDEIVEDAWSRSSPSITPTPIESPPVESQDFLEKFINKFESPETLTNREVARSNQKQNPASFGKTFSGVKNRVENANAQEDQRWSENIASGVKFPFKPLIPYVSDTTKNVGAGIADSIGRNVTGLLSKESAEVAGGLATPFAPLILMKELPKMLYGTGVAGKNAYDKFSEGDVQEGTASAVDAVLGTLMTIAGGKGLKTALKPSGLPSLPPKPIEIPEGFRGNVPLETPPVEIPRTSPVEIPEGFRGNVPLEKPVTPPIRVEEGRIPAGSESSILGPKAEPIGRGSEGEFIRGTFPQSPPKIEIPEYRAPRETVRPEQPKPNLQLELQEFERMLGGQQPPKMLPGLGQTRPPIQLPASLEGVKTGNAVKQMLKLQETPPQKMLPSAGQVPIPLPPAGGQPTVPTLPKTFNPSPRNARMVIQKPIGEMSVVELFKQAFSDETGAIGKDIGEIRPSVKLAGEARTELFRRAGEVAKQTGESAEQVFSKLLTNPNYGRSQGLVDPSGNPLRQEATPTLPESFTPKPTPQAPTLLSATPIMKDFKANYDGLPENQKFRQWGRQYSETPPSKMDGVKSTIMKKLGPKGKTAVEDAKAAVNMWKAGSTVMKKMGPAGKAFVDSVDNATFLHQKQSGQWVAPYLKLVEKLPDAHAKRIFEFLDGKDVRLNAQEIETAQKLRASLNEVDTQAKAAIPGYKGVENYFPHKPTRAFQKLIQSKEGVNWYEAWIKKNHPELQKGEVEALIKTVQANEDLGRFVSLVNERAAKSTAKHGNLYKKRFGIIPEEYIRKDKAVLAEYFDRAAEQIAENTYLGENMNKLQSLVPQIENAADAAYGQAILDNMRREGKPIHGIDKLYRKGRALNAFLLSVTSPIVNLTQRGNLFGVKGGTLTDVLRSFGSVYTKGGKEFALETGSTGDAATRSLARKSGIAEDGLAAKHHRFILMEATERGNRTAAANMGKKVAERQFRNFAKTGNKFAEETLSEMGIDVAAAKKRGGLSKDDLASAAFSTVKQTQGLFRPIDLPNLFTKSEGMRFMTQYRSAAHMQTGFVLNVLKELKRNPGKMALNTILLFAWMEGSGNLVNAIKDTLKGRDPEEGYPGKGFLSTGAGLMGDVAKTSAMKGGSYLPQMLLGPGVGGLLDVAQGALQKKPWKTLKPITSRIPFLGSTLTPFSPKDPRKKREKKAQSL